MFIVNSNQKLNFDVKNIHYSNRIDQKYLCSAYKCKLNKAW